MPEDIFDVQYNPQFEDSKVINLAKLSMQQEALCILIALAVCPGNLKIADQLMNPAVELIKTTEYIL